MKILYLITKSEAGGAQSHVYELCKYFGKKNEVVLMSFPGGWLEDQSKDLNIKFVSNKYFSNSINPFKVFKAIKLVKNIVKEFNPDIVHCHSSGAGFIGRLTTRNKIPTIFTAHGWGFNIGVPFLQKQIAILAEKFVSKYSVKIITVSEFVRKLGIKNKIAKKEKFEIIYNGIKSKVIPTGHQYSLKSQVIEVEAGALLGAVMGLAMQNGLSGMEWSAGIPGTIGGAVRGNAGAFGQATADVLEKVEVWQDGEVVEFVNDECEFVYRGSIFKENKNLIILRAWFKFKKADKAEVLKKTQEIIAGRKGKYPIYPSAGCFFTNVAIEKWPGDKSELPPLFVERGKVPAGWMIDQLDFKGKELGGASVGAEHCNFIVNKKEATRAEVLQLMEEIKEKVYNKYGVELQTEVEIF